MTIRGTQVKHLLAVAFITLLALLSFTSHPVFAQDASSCTPLLSSLQVSSKSSSVINKIEALSQKICEISEEIQTLMQELQELQGQEPEPPGKAASTASLELYQNEMNEFTKKINDVSKKLDGLQAELNNKQNELNDLSGISSVKQQDTNASLARPTPEQKPEYSSADRRSINPFKKSTGQVSEEPAPETSQSGSCNSPSVSEAIPTMSLLLIPAGLMLRRRRIGKISSKR